MMNDLIEIEYYPAIVICFYWYHCSLDEIFDELGLMGSAGESAIETTRGWY